MTVNFGLCRWVVAQSVFYHLYNQVSYMSLNEISPLTFSIGNTMKRVTVIVSSIIIFHTQVRPINAVGAAIAIIGTFLYSQVLAWSHSDYVDEMDCSKPSCEYVLECECSKSFGSCCGVWTVQTLFLTLCSSILCRLSNELVSVDKPRLCKPVFTLFHNCKGLSENLSAIHVFDNLPILYKLILRIAL